MKRRPWPRTAVVLVLMVAPAAAAVAAPPAPTPDPRAIRARIACDAGEVDRGVALLAEIAADNNDNNALFNQARCYQQNGRARQALERFKEYRRRVPRITAAESRQLDVYVRELETELAAQDKVAAPLSPVAPPVVAPVDNPAPARRTLLVPAAVTGAIGAAALVGGVYFSLKVRSLSRELEAAAPQLTPKDYRDKKSQGERAVTYQWIGYGAAAAALTASGVLLMMNHDSGSPEAARVSWAPAVAPGMAGGVLRLRW
jgi:tetratricopeptide (TPR) repeat protein